MNPAQTAVRASNDTRHTGTPTSEYQLEAFFKRYPLTDLGIAKRFSDKFGKHFLYRPGRGWFYKIDYKWVKDVSSIRARRAMSSIGLDIRNDAQSVIRYGENLQKRGHQISRQRYLYLSNTLREFGFRAENSPRITRALKIAETLLFERNAHEK